MTAVKYIRNVQNFSNSKSLGDRDWIGLDGLILALVCACFIIVINGAGDGGKYEDEEVINGDNEEGENNDENGLSKRKRVMKILGSLPSAFLIFLLGVVLAIIRDPKVVKDFTFGPSTIHVVKLSKHDWKEGFIKGTIPQVPLLILNSLIPVCKLSTDLFPTKVVSATSVSVSVGLMNLIGCWLGAMPCCHGAGGLAGQYKFGGRSGACVALLGLAKLGLGLVLGSSLVWVLAQFPVGVLGFLLLFAGAELAMCSRDMNRKEDSFVMILCTAVSLVGLSAFWGFVSGLVAYLILRVRKLGQGQRRSMVRMCRNSQGV